ncbi:MAG: hypothetical protein CH6_0035 [Candidatus Kapaibacterium sp.]|nr:MAG: hypothetical protein CH6_0035 [Candidatus Kapabacteria bacterium]
MEKIKELTKKIQRIPATIINALPETERKIFANYKFIPIDLLVPADWNYKADDEFMSQQLLNNIKRNGQIVTCQVRKLTSGFYEVVDGNHRLIALKKLGYEYVIVYDHGEISLSQAQRLAIETNETKFNADPTKLANLFKDLSLDFPDFDLFETLPFTPEQFNDILNSSEVTSIEDYEDFEDQPEIEEPIEPKTKRGDLYELNGHRLLCGDSTLAEDVAKLMDGKKAHLLFTDPPYNINYTELNKERKFGKGKDWIEANCTGWKDFMSNEEYPIFLEKSLANAKNNLIEYAHYYVWHATTNLPSLIQAFEKNQIPYDPIPIIWVKQVAPISWVNYWRIYEPCLFGGKGAINGQGKGARWFGGNHDVNVWNVDRDHNVFYIHPTQKPLALALRAMKNSSKEKEIVLDLFLGSGSTLIAADYLNRICYGIEYEPKFCDMIVLRFIKYCEDKNKEYTIKLNGKIITKDYFDYPKDTIKIKD